jgi:hypothetical protein
MSQITIVEDILNFTEVAHQPIAPAENYDAYGEQYNARMAKSLSDEEQRVVHELTSILISGRLPR